MNRSLPRLAGCRCGRRSLTKNFRRRRPGCRLDEVSSDWDREQQRLHQMNVAAVFGGEATRKKTMTSRRLLTNQMTSSSSWPSTSDQPRVRCGCAGTVEEEEIEEEEADLAHYVEELEEDAAFEELEEETHAAGEHRAAGAGNRGLGGSRSAADAGAVLRGTRFPRKKSM